MSNRALDLREDPIHSYPVFIYNAKLVMGDRYFKTSRTVHEKAL
jgi:hypothetical protein